MKKSIFLILLLFYFIDLSAQSYTFFTVSKSGNFVALKGSVFKTKDSVYFKNNGKYKKELKEIYDMPVYIFKLPDAKFTKRLDFKYLEGGNVEYAAFTDNDMFFYIKSNGVYYFWNLSTGKMIKKLKADTIVPAVSGNYLIAKIKNELLKIPFYYDRKQLLLKANNIRRMEFSPDGNYFACNIDNKRVRIWKTDNFAYSPKFMVGADFKFLPDNNFAISKIYSDKIVVSVYSLKENFTKPKLLKSIYSTTFSGTKSVKLILEKNFFSEDAYYVFTWKKGMRQSYVIADLIKGKDVFPQKNIKMYKKSFPLIFKDNYVLYQYDKEFYSVFDLQKLKETAKITVRKGVPVDFYVDEDVYFFYKKNNVLKIIKKGNEVDFDDVIFYENYRGYLFFGDGEQVFFYKLSDIFDKKQKVYFKVPQTTKQNMRIEKQWYLTHLSKFEVFNINEIFENKPDSKKLRIVPKSMNITEDNTALQFYVADAENNYYTGLKDFICDIYLENEYGEKFDVDNYRLTEITEKSPIPTGICYVLDHSGSMGENTTKLMQSSLISMFDEKDKKDEIGIVKFDDNVFKLCELTNNRKFLQSKFKITGLVGFGGGTALLDAMDMGLDMLIADKKVNKKNLVVLTDGYENASKSTKNQILLKAIENDISIYAIGLGTEIDEEFLRSISSNSNGAYYNIRDKDALDNLFNKVYRNMRNYYSVKFNTPYPGKFKLTVVFCNGLSDTLEYYFDNYIPDLLFKDDDAERDSLYEEIVGLNEIVFSDDFLSNKIDEDINFEHLNQDFDTLIFPDIKFYFDQTRIVEGTDKELINVINFMKLHPDCRIEVQGHTDSKGSNSYNEILSQKRAEKVKSLMVAQGISPERIRAVGYGEYKPIASNDTEEGRQKNRRVEFRLIR